MPGSEDEDEGYDSFSLNRGDYLGSLTASVYEFPLENGRTYHAYGAGKYYLPNDSEEKDREELVHRSMELMFKGKPFFAPLNDPQMILDVGTGTGLWAMKVADENPSASVIGIDLSPIQPTWTPSNLEFRVDDLEKDWIYNSPIDLVHSRICGGSAIRDWPDYLSKAYKALKPGGFVEAQDIDIFPSSDDNTFPSDSQVIKWHTLFHAAFLQGGCDIHITASMLKDHFSAVGFVNVTAIEFKLPMSPWPEDARLRDAGTAIMLSMLEHLEGLSVGVFTRFLGYEMDTLEIFLEKVQKEWLRQEVHGYWPLFVVYGQKPLSEGGEIVDE